jgi:hypothetical protein
MSAGRDDGSKKDPDHGTDQPPAEEILRRFHIFRTPGANFDVHTASERELIVHGLPPRPNPRTHPHLAAKWRRVADQRPEFIRPELLLIPSIRKQTDTALITRRKVTDSELVRYHDKLAELVTADRANEMVKVFKRLPETSNNWSGAYVKRPAAEPLTTVTGQWTVPGVKPPASAKTATGYVDGTYLVGDWVGIDGTNGTSDVMQAGTASQCVVSGGKVTATTFFAWVEWFSLPAIMFANFAVDAGDLISCTVCAPLGNTHGTAMFNNLTTGVTANVGIDPPSGVSLTGNVAEWIVEDPGQSGGGLFPFPNYGSTHFHDCHAGTKNIELDLSSGIEIDMLSGGTVISAAYIESNRTLFCRFGSL